MGNGLDHFTELNNPMRDLISDIKFDYNSGGIYTIKRVKSIETPNIFMDFHILIEKIDDRNDHQKLLKI